MRRMCIVFVENPSGGWVGSVFFFDDGTEMPDDVACHFGFGFQGQCVGGAVAIDDVHFVRVVSEACTFIAQAVEDDEVEILAFHFLDSV